jgi:hypothetical protein
MVLVHSPRGDEFMKQAVAAGTLELHPAEGDAKALQLLDRLASKQRARVGPDDPRARAAYATNQTLAAAREHESETAGSAPRDATA